MGKSVTRSNFAFFTVYFLYWLVLCWFDRTVFLINNWEKSEGAQDIFFAYIYGLRLDLSLACYLMVIPFLFYCIQNLFIKRAVSPWLLRIYTFVPTLIFALITIVNLPLYEAWGEKISKRAILLGMGTVGGVSSSIDMGMLINAALVLVLFFTIAHFFYHLFVVKVAIYRRHTNLSIIVCLVLGSFIIFTFLRGGYGRATLNPSAVYFSDHNVMNHLSVNTYWAFAKDMLKSSKQNPYQFMEEEEAVRLANEVLPVANDTIVNILKVQQPNVVVIILEGMVAQVFENLGGEKGITNNMRDIMSEGINFTRAYSAADRSDKGMIAVLSGFPSQGTESIIQYIPKHENLNGISQVYDSLGYSTSFYHGGQSEFYNFKSYMYAHGISRVVDTYNFPLDVKRNSWGVYDHVIASQMIKDLNTEQTPFFSVFYTLVNHEPYTLDGEYKFGSNTKADAYRSTAYYTDTMFNTFVEEAKKQDWYKNTIFVVVSDHGNIYPTEKYGLENPNRYHIPLFLFGGALKDEFRGQVVNDVVSQLDIASTLWSFVSADKSPFKYSTNLFAKNRQHIAFFNSNNTFGVVTNDQSASFDMQGQKIAFVENYSKSKEFVDRLIYQSKAYFQSVFKDFLSY
ncbi:LTA synthase family protein [Sphingobacterium rhinopitheci]|uniref:LTA synthase family protein n=1 Tax=Sphingobacterium rhinopitheci TaxID=2781960 RepID=UPI001F51A527|nr:alkaline phosphatase family protein [Sphingobacterium rhinopitheci]MCI0921377.1 sulfatase-like hydrolase/transferase [Sphingobacterium rhinopitheci]